MIEEDEEDKEEGLQVVCKHHVDPVRLGLADIPARKKRMMIIVYSFWSSTCSRSFL